MPRFHFQLSDSGRHSFQADVELPDPGRAREEAVCTAGKLLQDASGRFWGDAAWLMDVTDEQGGRVCRLTITGEPS